MKLVIFGGWKGCKFIESAFSPSFLIKQLFVRSRLGMDVVQLMFYTKLTYFSGTQLLYIERKSVQCSSPILIRLSIFVSLQLLFSGHMIMQGIP